MRKIAFIITLLLASLLSYLYWYYTYSADGEIHLLPKNFTGIVVIRYGSVDGLEREYESGKRVYKITPTGVLDSKFDVNTGVGSLPVFFYLDSEKRVPLNTNIKIAGMETGVSTSDITGKNVRYMSYVVGTENMVDSLLKKRTRINLADYRMHVN